MITMTTTMVTIIVVMINYNTVLDDGDGMAACAIRLFSIRVCPLVVTTTRCLFRPSRRQHVQYQPLVGHTSTAIAAASAGYFRVVLQNTCTYVLTGILIIGIHKPILSQPKSAETYIHVGQLSQWRSNDFVRGQGWIVC